MTRDVDRVVIIGAGIAGLCAAVYARRCGYAVDLLERSPAPGGLASSWRRGDYVFETCLHWLVGSRQGATLHAQWREVCDIDALAFVDHEEFVRIENEHGASLRIYADVERLEAELLAVAPEDEEEIRGFTSAVRRLVGLPMPPIGEPLPALLKSIIAMLPDLPVLWRLSHLSVADYSRRFRHPLLRAFFAGGGSTGDLSLLALAVSLAWMSDRNAGYALGGSQALIRAVAATLADLGGQLRCEAGVKHILVEQGAATGVELDSGEIVRADWVISAADGHATLHGLLGGRYGDPAYERAFADYQTFPSYLQVSLGVARDLSQAPGYLTLVLDTPLEVDPQTRLETLSFRIFNYDPTFAPPGRTAVTCFLPTHSFAWWADLRRDDPALYQAEKQRVAGAVLAVLERRLPGIESAVEVVDVSTPATVMRFTGNWRGSMEGWLMTPKTGFGSLPSRLHGLDRFVMAGQWVQPGGGLPTGLMTGRAAVQAICRQDRRPFLGGRERLAALG